MAQISACNLPPELLDQISSYLTWVELSYWARLNREHETCISPILYHQLKPYDHIPSPLPKRSNRDKTPPEPLDKSRCLILKWGASKGRVGTIKKVLASEDIGGRINIPIAKNGEQRKAGKSSMTLMHTAALNGHAHVIDYLVELGGDIHAILGGHIRPIHLAHTGEVVHTLVRHGGSLAPTGLLSISPLTHALSTDCKQDATKAFLELGCDPHARSLDGRTPGDEVLGRGDIHCLELLLKAGLDVSEASSVEGSWIYRAIEYLQKPRNATVLLHIVQLLIKHGAPAHGGRIIIDDGPWKVHYLQSNLFLAASIPASKDLVQVLLQKGAHADWQSWRIRLNPALQGDIEQHRYTGLFIRPDTPLRRLILSTTTSSEAEADANIDTLQVLVRHGARIDNVEGQPTLLNELLSIKLLTPGLVQMIFYLTGLLTQDPREPRYLAEPLLKSPIGSIHAFLAPDSAWVSPRPRCTSALKSVKLFTRLLELGADVNAPDDSGKTLLMLACRLPLAVNGLRYIRLLESHGADINFGSKDGQNALHIILRGLEGLYEEHRNRFQGLLTGSSDDQIDVNVRDHETGLTPLATLAHLKLHKHARQWRDMAAPGRDLRVLMARMLLRRGADVNITQQFPATNNNRPRQPLSGGTALHYACDSGDADLLAVLLDHSAEPEVNSFTEDGYTPLMILVRSAARRDTSRNDLLTMKDRLVQAGADVGVRNWTGKTAGDCWTDEMGRPDWFWESMYGDLKVPVPEVVAEEAS